MHKIRVTAASLMSAALAITIIAPSVSAQAAGAPTSSDGAISASLERAQLSGPVTKSPDREALDPRQVATGTGSAPIARIGVKDLGMAAFDVAKRIYKCENLSEQGLKCLTEPTIRDVLKKLDAIEQQISENQTQTMRALDGLQRSSDAQDLNTAVRNLDPIEAHILEAAAAWEALSACAEKASTQGATCKGYNGSSTEAVPVAEGMRLSRKFFLGQMDKIGISVEQATQRFAGSRAVSGTDGLAHALWKAAKGEQDRASTPEGKPIRHGAKPPVVVTRSLAQTFLPTMTYYRDLVYLYGALRPAAKELQQKSDEAQSEAKLADKNIFDTSSRWTVAGGFDFYRIPSVPIGAVAYVGKDGRLYKVVQGEEKGVPLRREVVQEIGDRIADYGYNADKMAQDPQLLPHRGEWGVLEKVLHRTHKEYLGRYAICASTASIRACDDKLDGTAVDTYEIGHSSAVGSTDSQGNRTVERWIPMRILSQASTWKYLIEQERGARYGSCKLIGEPPYGVHNVKFLQTYRRLMENHHADFAWKTVRYGYAVQLNVTPKCVGPGIYVTPGGSPYSVVDQGIPAGVLTTRLP